MVKHIRTLTGNGLVLLWITRLYLLVRPSRNPPVLNSRTLLRAAQDPTSEPNEGLDGIYASCNVTPLAHGESTADTASQEGHSSRQVTASLGPRSTVSHPRSEAFVFIQFSHSFDLRVRVKHEPPPPRRLC